MSWTAIISVAFSFVGITCGLAYKFSRVHKKIGWVVLPLIAFVLLLFGLTWTWGVRFADDLLGKYVDPAKAQSDLAMIDLFRLSGRNFLVLIGILVAFSVWMFCLRFVDDLKQYEQRLKNVEDLKAEAIKIKN